MATNKESVRRLIGEGDIQGNTDVIDELCTEDYINHEALSGDLERAHRCDLAASANLPTRQNQFANNSTPARAHNARHAELPREPRSLCGRFSADFHLEAVLLGLLASAGRRVRR